MPAKFLGSGAYMRRKVGIERGQLSDLRAPEHDQSRTLSSPSPPSELHTDIVRARPKGRSSPDLSRGEGGLDKTGVVKRPVRAPGVVAPCLSSGLR